ncbi:MAG: hypothetical protein AAFX51_09390 [Cyanobacteria bacterium J06636_28]
MSKPTISKPKKKPSTKNMLGEPEDNQVKAKNLSRPVQGVKKRINFEVAPEKKKEIQIMAASTGMTIGEMFLEAYEQWKGDKLN